VKEQARNIDPAVESVRAEAVVGERKAVASFRPLLREEIKTAACLKALIQPAEKTPVEKLTGEASGALNGKAQCRACRRGVRGNRAKPEGGPNGGEPAERFDPEGCKNPEGEWKLG